MAGTGFDSNATIDVYFDSTDVGVTVTDSNGAFGIAATPKPTIRESGFLIPIPKDAVPGAHWITAVERITQLQAQVGFTVRTDWPQFHFGADRTGVNPYENVLNPDTVGNLTTHWEYLTVGQLTPSPAVANGVVYVPSGYYDGNLYALDASTGALLWKYPAPTLDNPAPAVANGVVYFASIDSNVYALNAGTGQLLWKYLMETGTYSSVAVTNGVVYVGGGHSVYALQAATGALLWEFYPSGSRFVSPAVANGVVYVASQDGNLYALRAATGTLLWAHNLGGEIDGGLAVANGMVYVRSYYVQSYDSTLYALDAATGVLLWQHAGVSGYSAPAAANGVLYVGSSSLNAFDAGTGALLWQSDDIDCSSSAPAVANGVVYVGGGFGLYALNASTGSLLWQYAMDGVWSSPAAVNGMVYIGSGDGNLYAFGLPNELKSEKFSPPERPDPARLAPNWTLQPSREVTPPLKK